MREARKSEPETISNSPLTPQPKKKPSSQKELLGAISQKMTNLVVIQKERWNQLAKLIEQNKQIIELLSKPRLNVNIDPILARDNQPTKEPQTKNDDKKPYSMIAQLLPAEIVDQLEYHRELNEERVQVQQKGWLKTEDWGLTNNVLKQYDFKYKVGQRGVKKGYWYREL